MANNNLEVTKIRNLKRTATSDNLTDEEYLAVDKTGGYTRKMTVANLAAWVLGKIKSLTTITSFRNGDTIPVDGPSGAAKMSKDALLGIAYVDSLPLGMSVIDCSRIPLCGGRIGDDGTFISNPRYQGILLPVKDFVRNYLRIVHHPTVQRLRFAFLQNAELSDGSAPNYCNGTSFMNTEIILYAKIPEDCQYVYLYVYNVEASQSYFYPTVHILKDDYLGIFQARSSKESYIPGDVIGISNGFVDSTSKMFIASTSYRSCFIPTGLLLSKKIVLKRHNSSKMYVAFLSNGLLIRNELASFSTAYSDVLVLQQDYFEVVIPDDCEYIYLYAESEGNDVMPWLFCGDSVELMASDEKNKVKSLARLKILEFNVGGFANGIGFADPSFDVLKDLRHLIADYSPDVFIPCETSQPTNWIGFMKMQFSKWNRFPSDWGVYDVMPCRQCSGKNIYKDIHLRLDPSGSVSSLARNSTMFEVYIKGYRVAVVPVHFFNLSSYYNAGIDIDGVKSSFDDWFSQISESEYDAVLICGDTNIKWDKRLTDRYNLDMINYFENKGYIYVNGGCCATITPDTPDSFTQNFGEVTYTPSNSIIDQLLIKANAPGLRISATFKVLTSAEMQSKYPNLYSVTSSDHLPSIFDVYFG